VNHARVTGIVLAGGRSTRFGEDKLVAEVGGRPLLHLAIDVVATVVDEVVVVVGADAPAPLLPAGLRVPVVVARDAVADQGPLTGLAAGLAVASHSLALLVGGDQPALQPVLLRELLHRVGTGAADPPVDVIGLEDDGQLRPLPVAGGGGAPGAPPAGGGRSLVGLFARLRVETLAPKEWRELDPGGQSLLDIDHRDDLPSA
jgi:molybdopterin-guanine dinucleotide biosynthesis protein A